MSRVTDGDEENGDEDGEQSDGDGDDENNDEDAGEEPEDEGGGHKGWLAEPRFLSESGGRPSTAEDPIIVIATKHMDRNAVSNISHRTA